MRYQLLHRFGLGPSRWGELSNLGDLCCCHEVKRDRLPVLPKNSADLKNGSSRGFPIIVVEHPAQFIAAADAAHLGEARRRLDQFVLDSLIRWR